MADLWPDTERREVQVAIGGVRLVVDLRGGGLRSLLVDGWEVIDGYPAGSIPAGRRGGVLIPWPNRLRDGRYDWAGSRRQLDVASPEVPTANHGLLSWQPWFELGDGQGGATGGATCGGQGTSGGATSGGQGRVTVGTVLEARPGYPFRLAVALDYGLRRDHLEVTVRVRNVGDRAAPVGVGMHPYLSVGASADGDVAEAECFVPARTAAEVVDGLPTGRRIPFDGAIGRLGERSLDTPVTDLIRDTDGWARVRMRGRAGALILAVDEHWTWLQVYSGDTLPDGQRRRSIAVEPMTCPANALATGTDLIVLEPAATWAGRWTLTWSAADRTRTQPRPRGSPRSSPMRRRPPPVA